MLIFTYQNPTSAHAANDPQDDILTITGDESLPSNYLAGRHAANHNDYSTAALFFQRVLADDPKNIELVERVFLLHFADGNIGEALQFAPRILKAKPDYKLAKLLMAVKAFKDKKYNIALNHLAEKQGKSRYAISNSDVTTTLFAAWTEVTQGQPQAAIKRVENLQGDGWVKLYKAYHLALITDVAKIKSSDQKALNVFLDIITPDVQGLRLQEVALNLLLRAGRFDEAQVRLSQLPEPVQRHPIIQELQSQIIAKSKPKPLLTTGAQGVAEVLFGLGSILSQDQNQDIAAIYLYLSTWLNPNFDLAYMALGELYTQQNLPERAIEAYRRVNQGLAYRFSANLELAANLHETQQTQEAEDVLKLLIEQRPNSLEAKTALGSLYRQQKQFETAIQVYSSAIRSISQPKPEHWSLYYFRGMSYERVKNYPLAEQDLEIANTLQPNDPSLLNYLGYIWADQGKRLDEALVLIQKAVQLRPNNGYYIDSLAWVYYRMGDYPKALEYAQKAVQLRPADPTIVEHYGDILWRAGYALDARYNWGHALELKPESAESIQIIEQKIKSGL